MRGLTSMALLLGLSACAMPNPGFAIDSDSDPASGAADTSAASATSSAGSATTTATTATATTAEPMTGTVDVTSDASGSASTSTGEPGTTQTSEPVGSSTGDPLECALPPKNDALDLHVAVNGMTVVSCGVDANIAKGTLSIGSEIQLTTDPNCGDVNPPATVITLGSGYPPGNLVFPGCVTAYMSWNQGVADCQLGLLRVVSNADPSKYVLLAAFSVVPPAQFPIQPLAANSTLCGCPDNNVKDCCPELDPGELTLKPSANSGPVEQFNQVQVTGSNNQLFDFYNLQSWVGPECTDGVGAGVHIDWIAVATQ